MTSTPENPNDQTDLSTPRKWRRIIIISGLGLVTVSVAGGIAVSWWVKEGLAPMVSDSLTRLMQRPVQVGELRKFGLGYIEFGPSSLPATSTDSISASTEVVKVTFPLGPILFKTVKLDITFGESQAIVQQEANGSFAIPQLAQLPPPPLDIDIEKLSFPKLNVTIEPSAKGKSATPILLDLSKSEVLAEDEEERWLINLNGKVLNGGNFKVNAHANLKTSVIDADVVAKKLQLPIFAPLALAIENIPDIYVESGELDANLRAQVKISENIADILQDARGKVSLQRLKANTDILSNSVNLNTVANIAWPKVNVENLNANYGNIGLKVRGAAETARDLDLENIKLDLQAEVLPVTFDTLFNTATREINLLSNNTTSAETRKQLQQIRSQIQEFRPLVEGEVKTDVNLSGSLLKPVVSGKIESTEITRVDRLRFKDIATKFTISPELNQDFQLVDVTAGFSDLQINPVVGGKISGKGVVILEEGVRSQESEEVKSQDVGTLHATSLHLYSASTQNQEQETKFNPIVDLDLRVQNLPVEAIAQQYGFTSPLPIGDFSTDVKIAGPLETIKGQIQWQLPKAVYPLSGAVDIINSQANIKNTIVRIGGGTVNINGNANLENWQINATANQINLDNLEPLQPLGLPSGLEGLVNGKANFSGLTSKFSINSINGNASGLANIAGGQINLNGEVNNGNWQGKGTATQLSLSSLERIARNSDILISPNPILSGQTDGRINGEGTVSGNLNNLSLAGVTGNFDGNVNLANGIINASGKVNNGGFQALVNTEELPINPLLDLGLSAVNSGIITDQQQLNLIKTNIPRVKSLNGLLNGKVNLSGNLTNLDPEFLKENLTGDLTGNLKIEAGTINATGNLNRGNFQTTVNTNQIALTAVEKLFAQTGIVSLRSNILPRNTDGKVQGGATVSGNINNLTPEGITINGDGKVIIAGGTINAEGRLNQGNFQASVNSSKLAVNPLLDLGESILTSGLIPVEPNQIQTIQTQIPTVKSLNSQVNFNANLSGSLTNLSPEAITANTKSKIFIDGNEIDIDGRLNRGNFFADVETDKIGLRRLEQTIRKTGLVAIPPSATLPPGIEGELFGNLSIFANLNNLNPKAIAADGSGKLIIGNNTINATGKLDKGNFEGVAIADPIPLSFVKKIAKEIGVVSPEILSSLDTINGNILGNAKVAGNLDNLNPEAIAAEAEGKLIFAEGGAVNINGELVGQKWQAVVVGDEIPLEQFSAAIEKQEEAKPAVAAIRQAQQLLGQAENLPVIGGLFNSKIDLSGSLANLTPEAIQAQAKLTLSELPIIQKSFNGLFSWNQKQIEIEKVTIPPEVSADGIVGVDFPAQKPPAISGININVNLSDFNLASLPIDKLTEDLSRRGLVSKPSEELLTGRVNFDGKIIGESIADLNLVGDVALRNLAVNAVDFDSELSGTLNAGITQGVNVKIAGNNDRLELVLDETYFPTAFLVKRDQAKLAGVTEGENFLVTLEKFPLGLLGIAPAEQFGIGAVSGETSAKIALSNLRTFDINSIKADGNLEVAKPSIGYIDAESFTAKINYGEGKANLNDGTLLLGESRYVLQAMVDINSPTNPKFAATLNIEKGEAQDILTALQWFDLEDIGRGIATPNYASAADVQTSAAGFPENTSVIMQLRRFAEIQALLKQQQESEQPNSPIPIPPLADLDVTFSGEVMAEGSLQSGIDGKFDIKGSGWNWGIYKIDNFLVQGKYENDILTVKPLEVKAGEAFLAFNGDLSLENQTGKLQLKNVDLAEIQKFAQSYVPPNINITGKLNLETELGGNYQDPRAIGDINIIDGTLNEKPIENAKTDFSYRAGRLRFGGGLSIIGDPILYRGDVPIELPFATVSAGSDIINVSVNVKDDAFQIVNILTDQVTVDSGKGDVLLKLKGTLQQPQAEGYAKFVDVSITAAAFPEALTDLGGTVLFNGDRVKVEQIKGNISDGVVEVVGALPLLEPFSSEDPDINNPLTITLNKLNVNFQKAIQAGIDGKVVITGAGLQPDVGGNVEVSQGKVFLNEAAGLASEFAATGENQTDGASFGLGEFEIGLNNFQVTLTDSLQMISPGLANFQAIGDLKINGTLSDIRPSGTINLEAGTINLFSTDLRLDRNYNNTAKFIPDNGLDPILDIQLLASAFETSGSSAPRNASAFSAETIDAPSPGTLNSSRKVEIMATAKGPLSELEDNLELTSSPERSETQIVSLLGGNIVDTLSAGRNLALANVASVALFSNIQQDIIEATGLSEFRIFPATIPKSGSQRASSLGWGLEVGIDVTDKFGVSATILDATELSLDYEINDKVRLRGGSNFDDNAVLSIQYETRF
ncbi:translocation/assembly module TamB domain-containing protein [Dapis sp. BLCC M172]|uniref:translocation/assembly module TamB domain-containing protein n=1 Tax=Dapis sp. BLCC M172 TaxID=2975281 RepID=UPI003CEEBA05